MANDKDFILKNAVEVGGPTNVTLGTVTSDNLDLSTGNYFKDTPSGNSTYSISNAGDVQSFQLEVTGGSAAVAENFSTTLYTGTNAAQTITNGLDLSGDGGMVWFKNRGLAEDHMIVDTVRGGTADLYPNEANAVDTDGSIASFNSDGFTFVNTPNARQNVSGYDYVSWAFKQQSKFFDIVTYTGTSSDQTQFQDVSHNLGSVPGVVLVKRLNSAENWAFWHRSIDSDMLQLNITDSQTGAGGRFTSSGVSSMTSTTFRVYGDNQTGTSGGTYVAYLFAHDTAADSQIKCGSYTGNASASGPVIDLGWKPQWVLTKAASRSSDWTIVDNERGVITGGFDARLHPQSNEAEANNSDIIDFLSNGFQPTNTGTLNNGNNETYIYIAIRAASDPDITWPSSIEWAGGVAPSAPAVGETDVFTFTTDDGGTSYVGVKTADNLS